MTHQTGDARRSGVDDVELGKMVPSHRGLQWFTPSSFSAVLSTLRGFCKHQILTLLRTGFRLGPTEFVNLSISKYSSIALRNCYVTLRMDIHLVETLSHFVGQFWRWGKTKHQIRLKWAFSQQGRWIKGFHQGLPRLSPRVAQHITRLGCVANHDKAVNVGQSAPKLVLSTGNKNRSKRPFIMPS